VCIEKTKDGYEKKHEELNAQDFRAATNGDYKDKKYMYLELRVPYKHFNNESFMFMLLPGFEKKIDYWQDLIDFSVKCSDTSIFVFSEAGFSTYDNEVLLKKISEKFGDSLIYAISHSDTSSDDNEQVKISCMDVMHIPSHESDRVVCIGEYENDEKNEAWIRKLKNAIDKYCNSVETAVSNTSTYIYELIQNDIYPALNAIKDSIGDEDSILVKLENNEILKAFDTIVETRKRNLERQLEKEFSDSISRSYDKLEKLMSNKTYAKAKGIVNPNGLRRAIWGENIDDIRNARNRIKEAMQTDSTPKCFDYQEALVQAVENTITTTAESNACRKLLLTESDTITIPGEVMEENFFDAAKANEILSDARLLLTPNEVNGTLSLVHKDLVDTMRAIAEMGSQYFAMAILQSANENNASLITSDIKVGNLELKKQDITADLSSVQKVILGTLGVTGVDILSDGVLNGIPQLAAAIKIPIPIVGAASAAIFAATTASAVTRDINRMKRTELSFAKNTISSIHLNIKSEYLEAYSEAMLIIRERIEDSLIKIKGVNKTEFKKLNANISINKIQDNLDYICREVTNEKYKLGSAFRA
jgi:hypothetical protein